MATETLDNERGAPSTYDELIGVLEALPVLVREKRRRDRLSLRRAAELTGVGFNTISRFEQGEACSLGNAVQLLRWVGERTAPPPADRWVTWAGVDHLDQPITRRGVFVAETGDGRADVVEDEGSPWSLTIAELTFEDAR